MTINNLIENYCKDPKIYFKIENETLEDIPNEIINVSLLNYLEIRNCNLENITKIPINLRMLNVKNNKLSNINSDLYPENLKILNVDFNQFENLNFINNKIEKLFISNNLIKTIEFNPKFDKLDFLNISNNKLTCVDFSEFKNLKKLIISNNNIVDIDNLPDQLEVLESSNNNIYEINKLPNKLKKWISIDGLIQKINLTEFPENLIEINLEDNIIEEIIDMHDNLININLSNNNLKKMFKFNYKTIEYLNITLNEDIEIPNEEILKFKLVNLRNNGTILYEKIEDQPNVAKNNFFSNRTKIKHDTKIRL